MALDLVEDIDILVEYVRIKFGITPKTSSLINSAFKVYTDSATPAEISNPFQTIDLTENYNSIGKLLTLYWNENKLTAETDYLLVLTNIRDAAGNIIPDVTLHFSTGASITQNEALTAPIVEPIEIEDHSIKSTAFTNVATITAANPDMYIISVDPENQDFNLPEDYNDGKIAIKFSTLPNGIFLNNNYFKVQKKLVQRSPSRWQTISTNVIGESGSGIVYVSLPSTDATPVYGVAGHTYFEPQYKYRVIVSKDVGV
jgi:hypothetical protein